MLLELQIIRLISEGSCDTETGSNEIQLCHHMNKYSIVCIKH